MCRDISASSSVQGGGCRSAPLHWSGCSGSGCCCSGGGGGWQCTAGSSFTSLHGSKTEENRCWWVPLCSRTGIREPFSPPLPPPFLPPLTSQAALRSRSKDNSRISDTRHTMKILQITSNECKNRFLKLPTIYLCIFSTVNNVHFERRQWTSVNRATLCTMKAEEERIKGGENGRNHAVAVLSLISAVGQPLLLGSTHNTQYWVHNRTF